MNPKELQKNIALYYSKLPPKIQEVFSSMKWLEILKQISLKYDLNKEQQETLGTETTLVLLGIIHLDEYQKNLWADLNLPEESMDHIFIEINNSIIKTIRPELYKTFEENKKSIASDKVKNATPEQNINFILSGGDYSVFLEQKENIDNNTKETPETVLPVFSIKK